MKKAQPKKIIIHKELEKLLKEFMPGNVYAWELVEQLIENIRGLDPEEELFLKTRLRQHLGIDDRKESGTKKIEEIS